MTMKNKSPSSWMWSFNVCFNPESISLWFLLALCRCWARSIVCLPVRLRLDLIISMSFGVRVGSLFIVFVCSFTARGRPIGCARVITFSFSSPLLLRTVEAIFSPVFWSEFSIVWSRFVSLVALVQWWLMPREIFAKQNEHSFTGVGVSR